MPAGFCCTGTEILIFFLYSSFWYSFSAILDGNRNLIRKRMVLIILQPEMVFCKLIEILYFPVHKERRRLIRHFFNHFLNNRHMSVVNMGVCDDMDQFSGL